MLLLLIASGDTFTAAANEDEERKGKKRKRKKKANERAMATAATMDTVLRECLGCRLVPLCLLPNTNGCAEEGVDEKWQKRRENGWLAG